MQGTLLSLTAAVLPSVALAALQGPGYIAYKINALAGASPASNQSGPQVDKRQQDLPPIFSRYGSSLYTVDIGLGSANQPVPLQVDTGSSELWANPVCSKASQPWICQTFPRFTMSSTLVDLGAQQTIYAQQGGYVMFQYVTDAVCLGSAKILNQQFGVAYDTLSFNTGVLGLAPWSAGAFEQPYNLLLNSLVLDGLIQSPAFSLDLGAWDQQGGSLIFGAVDSGQFSGKLVKLPIIPAEKTPEGQYRYYVYLERLELTRPDDNVVLLYDKNTENPSPPASNKKRADDPGVPALINSAMAWSEFPGFIYQPLVAAVLDAYPFIDEVDGLMRVVCLESREPNQGTFDFTFGGRVIRVPFIDIIHRGPGNEECYIGAREGETVVLGDSFLRAAYAVFDWDNHNVFLAQSASCETSEIVNIGIGPDAVPSITGACPDIYATSTTSTFTSTSTSTTSSEEPTTTTEVITTSEATTTTTTEVSPSTTAEPTSTSTTSTESSTSTSEEPTTTVSSTTTVGSTTTETVSSSSSSSTSSTTEVIASTTEEPSTIESSTSSTESSTSAAEPTLISTTDVSSTSTVEPISTSTTESSTTTTDEPSSAAPSSILIDPALTSDVPTSEPSSEPSSTATEGVSSTVLPIVATGGESTTTNVPSSTAAPAGVTSIVDPALTSAASLTTSTVLVTTVYTVTSCAAGIICRPGAVTTEVRTSLTTFCPTASPVAPAASSSITLTTTSTRTYTITSCGPKFTACYPGRVTTELVTGTTVVCADDVTTSAVSKTFTCSLLGQGCAIGEVVTEVVPVTVIPAAGGLAGSVITLSGQPVVTGAGGVPGVGATAGGMPTQTGVAAPQWTTGVAECSTCGGEATGTVGAVLPVGTAGGVPPAVTAGAAKMSFGSAMALLGAGLISVMFV